MGTGCRCAKYTIHRSFNFVTNDVFPLASFLVSVSPTETKDVSEKTLGKTMATNNLLGQILAVDCQ